MYDTHQEGQLTYVGVTNESVPLGRERFGKVLGKNSYLKMGIKRQACGYGGRRDYFGEMGGHGRQSASPLRAGLWLINICRMKK